MKKWIIAIALLTAVGLLMIVSILIVDAYVANVSAKSITDIEAAKSSDAVIVLGAAVFGDTVSYVLAERLDTGYEVYRSGKAAKIIVSGDHGRKEYNEVSAMREYLIKKGVPKQDIFMDHAGFNTYDTLYRARDVFLVKKAIVVTQREHLLRALYIAKKLGLDGQGIESGQYNSLDFRVQRPREYLARAKAFLQCEMLRSKPKYLGETIPVSGSGVLTED